MASIDPLFFGGKPWQKVTTCRTSLIAPPLLYITCSNGVHQFEEHYVKNSVGS